MITEPKGIRMGFEPPDVRTVLLRNRWTLQCTLIYTQPLHPRNRIHLVWHGFIVSYCTPLSLAYQSVIVEFHGSIPRSRQA